MKGHIIIFSILVLLIYAITGDWLLVAIGACAYIATALILLERKLYYIDKVENQINNSKEEDE